MRFGHLDMALDNGLREGAHCLLRVCSAHPLQPSQQLVDQNSFAVATEEDSSDDSFWKIALIDAYSVAHHAEHEQELSLEIRPKLP